MLEDQKRFGWPQELRLRAGQVIAETWSTVIDYRETEENHALGAGVPEWHLCCAQDRQSITRAYTMGQADLLNVRLIRDKLVAHIMQCHIQDVELMEEHLSKDGVRLQ